MLNYTLIGAGGATGGIARFQLSGLAVNCFSRSLPRGTPLAHISFTESPQN